MVTNARCAHCFASDKQGPSALPLSRCALIPLTNTSIGSRRPVNCLVVMVLEHGLTRRQAACYKLGMFIYRLVVVNWGFVFAFHPCLPLCYSHSPLWGCLYILFEQIRNLFDSPYTNPRAQATASEKIDGDVAAEWFDTNCPMRNTAGGY
ncbi:hypothetical protein GGR57DRAFT_111771 [Xylariaceae sp. FL1272]|nr:hypothetical protein GGR57DRAFT_111771 [Xylariaceae sp. FL1272]